MLYGGGGDDDVTRKHAVVETHGQSGITHGSRQLTHNVAVRACGLQRMSGD